MNLSEEELGRMPVDQLVKQLNHDKHLGISDEEIERSVKVLNDQWFQTAAELKFAQPEDFQLLEISAVLSGAIIAFFQSPPESKAAPPKEEEKSQNNEYSFEPESLAEPIVRVDDGEPFHYDPQDARHYGHVEEVHEGHASEEKESKEHVSDEEKHEKKEKKEKKKKEGGDGDESETETESEHEEDKNEGEGQGAQEEKKSRGSITAIRKIVDHVVQQDDEAIINRLDAVMTGSMGDSSEMAKSVLREELKKVKGKRFSLTLPKKFEIPKAGDFDELDSKEGKEGKESKEGKEGKYNSNYDVFADVFTPDSKVSISMEICSLCKSGKEPYSILECNHKFCKSCIHDHLMELIEKKQAVGMSCPSPGCGREISVPDLQKVLAAEEMEQYFQATLLAFLEQDSLTMMCPGSNCKAAISINADDNVVIPAEIKEKDDEGRVLSKEAYKHFMRFRVRCRDCGTVFCGECKTIPYHKGFTCAQLKEYRGARHCRFCASALTPENTAKYSGPGLRDVCTGDECSAKADICCEEILPCGCPCNGVKAEKQHLPCLKHELEIGEDYCAICYVESLNAAPCIQSQGKCGHVYHLTCVKTKLEAKWPGARVSFDYRGCPTCKQPMYHPSIAALTDPIDILQKDVEAKGLERLQFEMRMKDAPIVNPNGEFYNNPIGYAMHIYLFYICFKCKKPYFAGGYQCQEANAAFDPQELVCPGCQPHAAEQDCPKHGKDWLVYKCKYCCNVASWFCWGNSHFCSSCHKPGVWQKMATFRTGANKMKLWEYAQCDGIKKQFDQILGDKKVPEKEKEAKMLKCLSDPKTCPLHAIHPPNGVEWGLGCSMCEDKRSEEENSAAAVRAEKEQKEKEQKMTAFRQALPDGKTLAFTYKSDFDDNGVIWWLATYAKTAAWANPAEAGLIKVSSSTIMNDSAPLSAAVGREVVRCVTKPERNSWFIFDLLEFQLIPTHYTLRHYSSWDTECVRHWVFEGSNDGNNWELLSQHVKDESLDKKGQSKTWKLPEIKKKYRMFRVFQTGRNSNNNYYLPISGFELYGVLSPGAPKIEAPIRPKFKKFLYTHDMDANGIMYYLGTNCGKEAQWKNPSDLGMVKVTSSQLAEDPPSAPASAFVGRSVVRCVTAPKPNSWFCVNLLGRRVTPTHYTLRHYGTWDLEALRNWRFEGSNDGMNWQVIANHVEDKGLQRKGQCFTWTLDPEKVNGAWSFFRIVQTGKNSNGHYYLAISGFELYGLLYEAEEVKLPANQPIELKYSQDFDTNGIFYWLGTTGKQAPWRNPADIGAVKVFSSKLGQNPPSAPANALLGRQCVRLVTIAKPNSWFLVDLLGWRLNPSHYTLMHYSSWDSEALRHWRFEASNDGQKWYILRQHDNDDALSRKGATSTWALPKTQLSFRLFRLVQTGPNSNGNHYLALSGLELYGVLTKDNAPIPGAAAAVAGAPIPVAGMPAIPGGMPAIPGGMPAIPGGMPPMMPVVGAPGIDHQGPAAPASPKQSPLPAGAPPKPQSVHAPFPAVPGSGRGVMPAVPGIPSGPPPAGLMYPGGAPPMGYPAMPPPGMPPVGLPPGAGLPAPGSVPRQSSFGPMGPAAGGAPPPAQGVPRASSVGQIVQQAPQLSVGVVGAPGTPPNAPLPPVKDGREFKYHHDFDDNGILYFVGTCRQTQPWRNPAMLGLVRITSVPLSPDSAPAWAIAGRDACRCVTQPMKGGFFVIDFIKLYVKPTAYTLRHYASYDTECIRDWKLQASNDGVNWTKINSHKKDTALQKKGQAKTWTLPKQKKAFRMFRILQTGENSNGHWYLALSGFEIYGKIYTYPK